MGGPEGGYHPLNGGSGRVRGPKMGGSGSPNYGDLEIEIFHYNRENKKKIINDPLFYILFDCSNPPILFLPGCVVNERST
jgi:hypothetical protein